MNDNIHPLRRAYIDTVRKLYKQSLYGDKSPELTEKQAMKIARLGVGYGTYVDVAVRLCAGLAKYNGWRYPYYNAVIGDKTIAKIGGMLRYTTDLSVNDNTDSELFEHELIYAMQYIDWWFNRGPKPHRNGVDIPMRIRAKVSEYLCRLYGVQFVSSNYNVVCKSLEQLDG